MNERIVDYLKQIRPSWLIMAGAAIVGLLCIIAISKNSWIPNPRLVHIANVAANFAEGKGFTSDALSDYIVKRKSIRHPEDEIPLGLPAVIGFLFKITGRSFFVTYLPAVLFFMGLGILTYTVAKQRFGPAVGLVAAFLVWSDVFLTSMAISGFPVIASAFFLLASAHYLDLSFEMDAKPKIPLWAGVFAGFGFLFDFGNWVIVVAFMLIFGGFLMKDEFRAKVSRKWLRPLILAGAFLVVISPWLIRNLWDFHSPRYPGMFGRYASQITSPSPESQNVIGTFQTVYDASNSPSYIKMVEKRGLVWFFIKRPLSQMKRLAFLFAQYRVFPIGLLLFGTLGLFWTWASEHRRWTLTSVALGACSLAWMMSGTFEARDFFVFIPFAAIFAAYFLVDFGGWVWKEVSPRAAIILILLMILLFGASAKSNWSAILRKPSSNDFASRLATLNGWIINNTAPGDVIMTRMPEHVAYDSGRAAIGTPLANWQNLLKVARRYGVKYLIIEQGPAVAAANQKKNPDSFPAKDWMELFLGNEVLGAKLVFSENNLFFIYLLPEANQVGAPQP